MLPVSLPRVSTCGVFYIQISVLPIDRNFVVCKLLYKCKHTCIRGGNKSVSSLKCLTLVLIHFIQFSCFQCKVLVPSNKRRLCGVCKID